MSFSLIASSVISLLVPYATKAMEQFSGEAGKAVFKTVGSMFSKIKSVFTGDASATDTLDRFEKDPEKYKPFLEDVLKEKLEKDPKFTEEIAQLLKQVAQEGPELSIVQKMQTGENIIGVDAEEIVHAKINVEQDITHGTNVTGVKGGKIGK